jgi:malate dehydrogenase (oxaloacetate-decarboxylating)(NADP+)
LIVKIAPAVAKAAMDSGVATRPIADLDAYRDSLQQFVYHSGMIMKPLFSAAKEALRRRIVYAEGEDERVLRAVQVVVDEKLAFPVLVGRPAVIERRIERYGLRLSVGTDFELINPEFDPRYRDYWEEYYRLTERKGVSRRDAAIEMRRQNTLIGAMAMHRGEADGMICGTLGTYYQHFAFHRPGDRPASGSQPLLRDERADAAQTHGVYLRHLREFRPQCRAGGRDDGAGGRGSPALRYCAENRALLSHSSFGTDDTPTAKKMRAGLALLEKIAPQLEIEGEMHGDAALSEEVRQHAYARSRLKGEANLLIMPTLDAANIAFNLLKTTAGGGITVGPMLLGPAKAVHIVTPTATVRRIVNMTALTVVDVGAERGNITLPF